MVSRILSITLAFALVATASFAAGGSDSDDSAAAADKRYVTDPVTGKVFTAPEYGATLTYLSTQIDTARRPRLRYRNWAR